MTLDEFLAELGKVDKSQAKILDLAEIRIGCDCPITAVVNMRCPVDGGPPYNFDPGEWSVAASQIGLEHDLAVDIVVAADTAVSDLHETNQEIRRKLFAVLALDEEAL